MQTNIIQNAPQQNAPIVVVAEASSGVSLPDGQYQGVIANLSSRTSTVVEDGVSKQVTYVDFHVAVNGQDATLKVGYPLRVTPRSDLGSLLTTWGIPTPAAGAKFNLSEAFLGKHCAFLTRNETNADGTFTRIVKGSLRPSA